MRRILFRRVFWGLVACILLYVLIVVLGVIISSSDAALGRRFLDIMTPSNLAFMIFFIAVFLLVALFPLFTRRLPRNRNQAQRFARIDRMLSQLSAEEIAYLRQRLSEKR